MDYLPKSKQYLLQIQYFSILENKRTVQVEFMKCLCFQKCKNIKSVTDFGIFVGLEGDIDGLIHLSDITEDDNPSEAMENYKKGDKLSCIIFGIDAERERISLKLSAWNT